MTKTIDLSAQTPMTTQRMRSLLRDSRRAIYKDLTEGWFAGPWGVCEMCRGGIIEGEVGYRTKTGFVMHNRCMGGVVADAPPDNIDGVKDELKEMFS